ncbi:MAG: carboxymuconolactone decarboxylase family protein [Bdellovibrionales bacterium]
MTYNFEALPLGDFPIARDLRINFERLVGDGKLPPDIAMAVVFATATTTKNNQLVEWAQMHAESAGLTPDLVKEAQEVAGIMGMLNMYYRFRHFIGENPDYTTTGLRMTSLAKPQLGKERFEILALAVSVINGCEKCVVSHEKALRDLGVSVDVLHDVARLSAVVKGIGDLP